MFKLIAHFALFFAFGQAYTAPQDDVSFTRDELERMSGGELLIYEKEALGPWPKYLIIGQLKKASPLQAMSVFADFEDQKNYVPGVLKSEIVKRKRDYIDVSYELKTPWPLDNSTYTNRHHLDVEKQREGITLRWNQMKGNATDSSKGHVTFEKRFGSTFMIYESHVIPKSMFAGIFTNTAKKDMLEVINEIVKFIDKEVEKSPEKISERIKTLKGHYRNKF